MKKLLAVILAITLALSMTVFVSADDEIEIPLDADHLTGSPDYFAPAESLTFADGAVTADDVEIIAFALHRNVVVGETVTVHIKGSADGDFRVWLIGADVTASKGDHATFSEQWKSSENGFTGGEFEYYITLTAADAEPIGGTEANKVCFKAPAAHGILDNLTVTYLGITYPSADELAAEVEKALEEIKDYVTKYEDALAAAQAAAGDKAALEAALADAQAAADSIAASEGATRGYPAVTEIQNNAKQVIADIQELIKSADSDTVLEDLQSYIDTVNNALTTAQNAGPDVAAVENALAEARTALDHVREVANDTGYADALAASRELKSVVEQIESLLEDSRALKAQEDAESAEAAKQAEEDAAKARKTTTVVVIAVAVASVVIIAVAVVMGVLKKKEIK